MILGSGIIYLNEKIKKSNKNIIVANPKGGAFITDCVDPDSVY